MPKHYKEMIDEIINKMDEAKAMGGKFIVRMKRPGQKSVSAIFDTKAQADAYEKEKKKLGFQIEDAPANSVAGGGVDMNPTGAKMMSPKMMRRKKQQGDEQEKITKKISKMIKANEDNNNVILKQVNESLSKVEDKSDEKLGLKQDVDIEEKKYKTFRDKYNA
tara:strand:- start:284 stop:772 length:489 start_codon:yes stop_codon:yes gene_type:complete